MERKAWLTFLSSNNYYIYLLLGLYKNLKDVNTKYPIYCGVTKEVDSDTRNILKTVGIKLIDLDTSVFSYKIIANSRTTCTHYAAAFTKLALLDTNIEKMFDKIVYIDTDVQIIQNMDELFDKPHMSAIPDCAPASTKYKTEYKVGDSKFCSGLFVWDFKANPGKGHEILKNLDKLDMSVKWHDQNVLNYFYNSWNMHPELQLNTNYGLMNIPMNFRGEPDILSEIKAIHYVSRIRDNWPFTQQKKLSARQSSGFIHFKEWIEQLATAINYFNSMYNLTIPRLHPENLIYMTEEQEKAEKADGKSNFYLYF